MLETSARLLRLLSLLQAHREWSGADLADRLGVTARTVRRDVDRLRELGYPVNASPGTGGGYQLGAGAELPPLLLDDDEAVAVAVGLRTAAGQGIEGIGETSVRALTKLGTGAAEPVAPPGGRPQRVHRADAAQRAAVRRRPGRADRAGRAVPGRGTAALRLREPRRHAHPPQRRTAPPGLHRAALVPRRLGPGARGLAHLPRRPHRPQAAARAALHPARAPGRGSRRTRLERHLHARVRRACPGPAARAPPGGGPTDLTVRRDPGGRRTDACLLRRPGPRTST